MKKIYNYYSLEKKIDFNNLRNIMSYYFIFKHFILGIQFF